MPSSNGWETDKLLQILVHDNKDYGFVVTDRNGKITYANRGAEIILECGREKLMTMSLCDFFTPEDQKGNIPQAEQGRAARAGNAPDERWHIRSDGSRFWASGVTTVIKDDGGNILGFSKIFRDQTLRKETENHLIEANSELTLFAGMASHDLQEPLRGITISLQILQKNIASRCAPEEKENLDQAIYESVRMKTLIEDMLAFAREGKEGLPLQLTECNAAFDAAVAALGTSIASAKAKVTRGILPSISGVPSQLQRLFQNLIANAIKFKGEHPPIVIVDAVPRENEWLFSVKDNGIGIDSPYFETIFEPFRRLNARSTYPGSGLGLSTCKKIVEAHGGRIWVESSAGRGSTFFITLPFHLDKLSAA